MLRASIPVMRRPPPHRPMSAPCRTFWGPVRRPAPAPARPVRRRPVRRTGLVCCLSTVAAGDLRCGRGAAGEAQETSVEEGGATEGKTQECRLHLWRPLAPPMGASPPGLRPLARPRGKCRSAGGWTRNRGRRASRSVRVSDYKTNGIRVSEYKKKPLRHRALPGGWTRNRGRRASRGVRVTTPRFYSTKGSA
jgi:hypothetical protein